jgi:hypothetical protein
MTTPCNTQILQSVRIASLGRKLSSSIPVREYRSVENVFHCWLHSVRNASCGFFAFLPSDASRQGCRQYSGIILSIHKKITNFIDPDKK